MARGSGLKIVLPLGVISPGERVLDAGCGAGLDCLIASGMVGPGGEVIGVDMAPEMIEKAQKSALAVGAKNLFFKLGFILWAG